MLSLIFQLSTNKSLFCNEQLCSRVYQSGQFSRVATLYAGACTPYQETSGIQISKNKMSKLGWNVKHGLYSTRKSEALTTRSRLAQTLRFIDIGLPFEAGHNLDSPRICVSSSVQWWLGFCVSARLCK